MNRVKILSKTPSFPAIWAAAVSRPPVPRANTLPETVVAVRGVRVDAARSARFDEVLGGEMGEHVHPGFLHCLALPVGLSLMAGPRFPTPLFGLVHLRNQFLQHRPVRPGEKIDIDSRVQNLRDHPRGRTFETVSVMSAEGSIVATDVSTYLARGNHAPTIGAHAAPGSTGIASGRDPQYPLGVRGSGRGARLSGVGESLEAPNSFVPPPPTARWKLPSGTGRVFAAVSGDASPIHLSGVSARIFGLPSATAQGMYAASRALTEARPDWSRPLRWDVEFDAPVLLPATVWVTYRESGSADLVEFVGYHNDRGSRNARRHFAGAVRQL